MAAEYALVTARQTGSRSGRFAEAVARAPPTAPDGQSVRFISTVQVGITISAILLGAIGEPLLSSDGAAALQHGRFPYRLPILTYLSVVLGELVPKAVALKEGRSARDRTHGPARLAGEAAAPLVWALQKSANVVLRLLRVKPAPARMIAYTREDIRHSVAAAEDVGELEEAEEEMLYKVFDVEGGRRSARAADVVAISFDMAPEEALATVVDSPRATPCTGTRSTRSSASCTCAISSRRCTTESRR